MLGPGMSVANQRAPKPLVSLSQLGGSAGAFDGIDLAPKVLMVASLVFFAVMTNTRAGGYGWIFVAEPFVAAATSGTDNVPRKAKLQDGMRAQKTAVVRIAGIAGAKFVVAINSDEQAPIFQWAHLGIVDDYRAILPELIGALHGIVPEAETI